MDDTLPAFTQIHGLPLYALSTTANAGVSGYWAGYQSAGALGAAPTLDQVWQDAGGVYLFLGQAPGDSAAFSALLSALLPRLAPGGALRALWLANPNAPSSEWQIQMLLATAIGSGAAIAWTVARDARFLLGAYAFVVRAGALMTEATPAQNYGIAFDAAHASFFTPTDGFPATGTAAVIPFAGGFVGALTTGLSVANSATTDGMARLGVRLRYAVPASADPGSDAVTWIAMPILRQPSSVATVAFALSYDPLNPTIAVRTNLAFAATPTLTAYFVTARGNATTLTPITTPAAPLWPARLAFCATPLFVSADPANAYADYYLAPDGAFTIAVASVGPGGGAGIDPTLNRVIPGASGLEYIGLPQGSQAVAFFTAGRAAFAPSAVPGLRTDTQTTQLTALATTAYATFLPTAPGATALSYYAQPRQSPLFTTGTDLGPGFMDYLELVSATLPAYPATGPVPATLPVAAFGGIDPALASRARLLEEVALAPARRAAVGLPPTAAAVADDQSPLAVTPKGLIATLNANSSAITGLVIGNVPGAAEPRIAFTGLTPKFQGAVLANDVFFIVSNVTELMSNGSVRYRLAPDTLALLPASGVPQTVVDALTTLLGGRTPPFPVFDSEADFTRTITPAAGSSIPQILPIAGMLKVTLDRWTFQLSPRAWRAAAGSPTIMIAKFSTRSLEDLAADLGAWGWPDAARDGSGSLLPTQKIVQDFIRAAAAEAAGAPERAFYENVAHNPLWNGVLFINAPVAVAELPAELQFVTAGIDATAFFGHHVGFSLTPFEVGTTMTLKQTAVFALIDYRDPRDLALEHVVPFAFKTTVLRARFANAHLADFSAQVELMLNRLFGADLTKQNATRGNNLVLDGGYSRQGNAVSYSFALGGRNVYDVARSALMQIEVLGVQLQTSTGTDAGRTIRTDFVLSGNLGFEQLESFDLFSYGPEQFVPNGASPSHGLLRFGNLVVRMTFPLARPEAQTFQAFEGERLSFDLASSVARPRSLAQHFPLRLTGCIAASAPPLGDDAGQRPEDLGYVSVFAPITQTPLTAPWYGLVFDIDLGTLGALAGSLGLHVSLLAAWQPGADRDTHPIYLGLKLPSGDPLSGVLPIQGVTKLGFRSVEFSAYDDSATTRSYMLRLRRFALSILAWSFPPGNTDLFLFGNPTGNGRASLGWYGAYVPDEDRATQSPAVRGTGRASPRAVRRLQSGRRTPPAGGA
ncbi:MAG TPA: hypothetical protein VI485_01735 [Vicinamibacterales bacterium]|nr:hypothetical protein [Vicinamibacterales bacterium]